MTEDEKFIDKNIYKALIDNNSNLDMEEPSTEWDPYYITKLQTNHWQQVFLRKKPEQDDVIKFFVASDEDNDDDRIKILNKELNKNDIFMGELQKRKIKEFKEFLKEKKEKTEESQESKENSKMVKEGEIYKYQGKNGKIQVGKISNTQEKDGEYVNGVRLLAQIPSEQKAGKRKSKKSKKPKKSKKSKTRKNSRKTNRRR